MLGGHVFGNIRNANGVLEAAASFAVSTAGIDTRKDVPETTSARLLWRVLAALAPNADAVEDVSIGTVVFRKLLERLSARLFETLY